MSILKKIRSLSKKTRKMILWLVMFVLTVFLFSFYIQGVKNTLKEREGKELLDSSYFQEIQKQAEEIKETIFDNIKNGK